MPYNDKVRLLKNIAVRIAPIEANYAYGMTSEKNVAVQRVLDGWSVLADELMLWDYTAFFYDGYNQYFPDLCYLKENLQYYKSRGVSYVMNQSSHTAGEDWQGALKYYVSSKLYWDLDLSVSDLVDEFILYYHGGNGGAVRARVPSADGKPLCLSAQRIYGARLLYGSNQCLQQL